MTSQFVWDQHACLPLQPGADVAPLARFAHSGGSLVSVNAGYSPQSFNDTMRLLNHYRRAIDAHPNLAIATSLVDIDAIIGSGQVAVVFDLEDTAPLDGNLDNLATLADNGVRTLVPTYNYANAAGSGCLDAIDNGLTAWGRDVVAAMNTHGVVPDGSHSSVRTGLKMCEISSRPVIYSHSCMRTVWNHPRNITDDQARACAATGGVVGITGVGIFLGPNTPTLDAMTRHLEYAVDLLGIQHVGISSDFSFDHEEFNAEILRSPDRFDDSYTRWGPIEWMTPETFLTLAAHLKERGWPNSAIRAVLGDNFKRVARQSWATSRAT